MPRRSEIGRHLLRTLLLVAAGTIGFFALFGALFWLRAPPLLLLAVLFAAVGVFVWWTARRQGTWAPVAQPVDRHRWSADGTRGESIVEEAIVGAAAGGGASSIEQRILRLSVYDAEGGRRARVVLGDDAAYLGHHGDGFWFFVADRFHGDLEGLVCLDPVDARVRYHRPRDELEIRRGGGRAPSIEVRTPNGKWRDFDLRTPAGER